MLVALIVLGSFLWYATGVGGFVYWWSTEFDFTTSELPLALVAGVVGILSWPLGFCIHGRGRVLKAQR